MPSVPSSISNLKVFRALNPDLTLVLGFEASKSDLDAILSSRSFHPISYASAGPSVASALKNAESVNIEAIKFTKCYSSFSKDHPYVYYFIIGEDDRHARFLKLGF